MGRIGRVLPGVAVAAALTLLGAGPTSASAPGASAARHRPSKPKPAWHVHRIVSASQFVEGSELSVSNSGHALLDWVQGAPPQVCSQPCPVHAWHGYKVMFAQGMASGGFGHVHQVSAKGNGGVYAAQLSSVGYVAWNEFNSPGWRIAAVHNGHVSKPTVLPADAQLQGLFTGHSKQAVAVWITPGNPRWLIHYAFLGPNANFVRQGDIARISSKSFTYPQIAVNDQGDLAAVWASGPKFTAAQLAWCDAGGFCVAPRSLPIQNATPYLSIALTDAGTVAAFVQARPTAIWTAIAHVGKNNVRVHRLAAGLSPMAVSEGRSGVAAMFSPTPRTLARTFLRPATGRFTKPIRVRESHASPPPQLAANLSGQFVTSWFHAKSSAFELRASTGTGISPKGHSRRVVASARQHPGEVPSSWTGVLSVGALGLSGQGNAVISWERLSSSGPHGLFVGLHHLT